MFDHFSCFVVTVQILDKSAKTVCSSIYSNWIATFGCPDSIRTVQYTELNVSIHKYGQTYERTILKITHHIEVLEITRVSWCTDRTEIQDWKFPKQIE